MVCSQGWLSARGHDDASVGAEHRHHASQARGETLHLRTDPDGRCRTRDRVDERVRRRLESLLLLGREDGLVARAHHAVDDNANHQQHHHHDPAQE